MTYTDECHRYARREDWDCLMWAWDTMPEVQANWGGPGPWRQSAGGEKRYAHRRSPRDPAQARRHDYVGAPEEALPLHPAGAGSVMRVSICCNTSAAGGQRDRP